MMARGRTVIVGQFQCCLLLFVHLGLVLVEVFQGFEEVAGLCE
jgi:hypothetical protein